MVRKIKDWLKRHIDYRIVGEYWDSWTDENGCRHSQKKYKKKYFFKK